MKYSNNRFESKSLSETSIFRIVGSEPALYPSSAEEAGCRISLGKGAGSIRSKKQSLAMRTRLNLKIMTLAVCAVFTLFAGGLRGEEANDLALLFDSDSLHASVQLLQEGDAAPATDPLSGTWVLNLSKSKFPPQFSILKGQTAYVVVDASDIEITQETVYGSNERFAIHVKAKFDGKDYPITGVPGSYTAAYRRLDKNTIKALIKENGRVILEETGIISPDGKSFAVTYYTTDETDKQTTVSAVFEKK